MSTMSTDDATASIVVRSRRFDAVATWMHRVVQRDDRPLPMLIVSGPVASGKTVGVREAARAANVRLVELGSDSTADDDVDRVALVGRREFARWQRIVETRSTLGPRALFIDDAEALLAHAQGGKEGLSIDDFVALGAHALPIIVAVADFYAGGAVLRSLRTRVKGVEHAKLVVPTCTDVQRRLAIEFPFRPPVLTDTCWGAAEHKKFLQSVAAASGGDLRRARLAARHPDYALPFESVARAHRASTTHEQRRSGQIGADTSLFDQAKALLGVQGTVPRSDEAFHRAIASTARQLGHMVRTHYASVVDGSEASRELVADTAAWWSALDVMRCDEISTIAGDFNNAFDEYVSLDVLMARARRHQRTTHHEPSAADVDLAQPLRGRGSETVYSMRMRACDTVAALERWQWMRIDGENRLVLCPHDMSVYAHAHSIETSTSLARLWREREFVDYALAVQQSNARDASAADRGALVDIPRMTDAVNDLLVRGQGQARRPWDKVPAAGKDDVAPKDIVAKKRGTDERVASGKRTKLSEMWRL